MSDQSSDLNKHIAQFSVLFPELTGKHPWDITLNAFSLISKRIEALDTNYRINHNIAIHKKAHIEDHSIIKGPAIISAGCFVGAHAYLRGGVFLGENVTIGPGCEVKSSFILSHSALAHFNFAGDSIIGSHVNMEAGSVIANYFNERKDKTIYIKVNGTAVSTGVEKFGALVGDHTKIGANAVISPGTILPRESIVKRLELVEQ